MNLMEALISAKLGGSGGGGSVTPESVLAAMQSMTGEQALEAREALGAADATSSIPDNVKQAFLACFENVAWADTTKGLTLYSALEAAFYPTSDLQSITAVYTQSRIVYANDSLDDLKVDLVVTAEYINGATRTIPGWEYTLSGTLTAGTSAVTVSYGGETATFSVNVTPVQTNLLHSWDLRESLTDSVGGIVAVTTATRNTTGLVFDAIEQYCDFGAVYGPGKTFELDVVTISTPAGGNYRRVLMADVDPDTAYGGGSGLIIKSGAWSMYSGSGWITISDNQLSGVDALNGKTLRVYVDNDMIWHMYAKTTGSSEPFTAVGASSSALKSYNNPHLYIGGSDDDYMAPATFSEVRVYEGQVE